MHYRILILEVAKLKKQRIENDNLYWFVRDIFDLWFEIEDFDGNGGTESLIQGAAYFILWFSFLPSSTLIWALEGREQSVVC